MTSDRIGEIDKRWVWHPFTPMREWCAPDHDPLVLVSGRGVWLRDSGGREYIDGNSSIWTNIHGHSHPVLNAALRDQLERVAHTSFLGCTNEPAARLAEALVTRVAASSLEKVFYSDDGSTAVECAMKMAVQFRQMTGSRPAGRFIAFDCAYHGDTLGASALGGIPAFHQRFEGMGATVCRVADVAGLESLTEEEIETTVAVAIEPLVQGAAGIRLWPAGMLRELRAWCDRHDIFLICDEVMTGFGRTGTLFACEQEGVWPDFLCLAKGLSGGYLPLGATLTTRRVFDAFLSEGSEMKTFYHGHSYAGNPLACAAGLASLRVFDEENVLAGLPPKIELMRELLAALPEACPGRISTVRQCGLIAGIDLTTETGDRGRAGARLCRAAREFGLLTRPIGDTVVLMPPLCVTAGELRQAVEALRRACESLQSQ